MVAELVRGAKQANANLAAYQDALDRHGIVVVTDAAGVCVLVNDRFCELSGYARAELLGQDLAFLSSELREADGEGKSWRGDVCHRTKSGAELWLDVTIVPLLDAEGRVERHVRICHDITALVVAEADAVRGRAISALISRMQAEAISSNSTCPSLNHAVEALLRLIGGRAGLVCEWARAEDGAPVSMILGRSSAPADAAAPLLPKQPAAFRPHHGQALLDAHRHALAECLDGGFCEGYTARDLGASHFVAIPIVAGAEFVGVLALDEACLAGRQNWTDIDEFASAVGELVRAQRESDRRRRGEEHAQMLGRQDALTGLGNRRALLDEFDGRIDHPAAQFGLILVDLDRFKPINDVHGHLVGDQVLKAMAQRLRAAAPGDHAIARLGGDEFAILTDPAGDVGEVATIASTILESLTAPVVFNGLSLSVGASIGVAMYPADARNAQQLLQYADAAMHRAKQRRGEVQFFESSMDEIIQAKAELEVELRAAIASDAIAPYYQPVVCLQTGAVVGHEMLARWSHKDRGAIAPAAFISIAQEAGLIDTLFWQLLGKACAAHLAAGAGGLLSVNISPSQIGDKWFAQKLIRTLTHLGFPPSRLEIEVTESDVIADSEKARAMLLSLRNQGVRLALDDFGTGYSSLLLLRDLPINKVKIDRSFVSGMALTGGADAKIVDAVLGVAGALKLAVTAEGIESEAVAALLRAKGCQFGQGFLFGAAQPDFDACASEPRAHVV